jgi:hypothetical protein
MKLIEILGGSSVANPYLWLTDSDPDPAIFVSDLQDGNLKKIFAYFFLKLHFYHFFIDKKS